MTVTSKIILAVDAEHSSTLGLGTARLAAQLRTVYELASGVGADQADLLFTDERTIAASGNEDLDLAGGLNDAYGNAITFARIKAVAVVADAANTNEVHVSQPATNGVPLFVAAGDGIRVRPGGANFWVATDATGIVVTAGTGDLLNIANSGAGTSVTYKIAILGASA